MSATHEHPVFGTLTFTSPDTWDNRNFRFGGDAVQLLIQAGPNGPREEHVQHFREFVTRYSDLMPRITESIDAYRGEADRRHSYVLSTIYLPDPALSGDLSARLWFDDPAEEIAWFGVEIYAWDRIVPFAED